VHKLVKFIQTKPQNKLILVLGFVFSFFLVLDYFCFPSWFLSCWSVVHVSEDSMKVLPV